MTLTISGYCPLVSMLPGHWDKRVAELRPKVGDGMKG
jgi:hypothetical protein